MTADWGCYNNVTKDLDFLTKSLADSTYYGTKINGGLEGQVKYNW